MPQSTTSQWANSHKLLGALLGLLALIALLGLWYLSNNQQVGDSLGIAYYVKVGQDTTNPHHLLFGPIIWLLHRLALLFAMVDVLAVGQAHNIAWATVALISFAWLVWRFTANAFLAFFAGLVLLLSHQFWQYSTQFEVYIPALGCLALLLALLIGRAGHPLSLWIQCTTAGLLFLSITYHQMGVLFVLPLLVLFGLQWGRAGVVAMVRIVVVTGLFCLVAYALVYIMDYAQEPSLAGFAKYCVIYAYSNPDWGTFKHFGKTAEIARIFINIKGAFLAPYWADKITVWVAATGFTAVYFWNAWAACKRYPAFVLRWVLIVWLAVYFLFLLWWTPGYEFFTMLTWPILLLAIFALIDVTALLQAPLPAAAISLALLAGMLVYVNGPYFAAYHHQHDEGYEKAAELMRLNPNDCWMNANFNVMLNLKYFHNNHRVIESDGLAIDYYYRNTLPPHSQFMDMDCVLMEMWYYNPWYGPMGENGFSQPEQWLQLTANLFRFQRDESGALVAAAPYQIVTGKDQSPYLLVNRTATVPIAGYAAFFAQMDSLVALLGQEKDKGYLNWYKSNEALMPK